MKKARFFITGTDTDAGKTVATLALLHAFKQQGLQTVALKPLAAGCEEINGELRNADALKLQAAATVQLPYEQVNPVALKAAMAPHIAAEQEGRRLLASRLAGLIRGTLMTPADVYLVEGAGGWYVPLNERETLANLVKDLQIPVILVVGMRLGCLNHAILSARAIQLDGVRVAGWIANCVDPDFGSHLDGAELDANVATLQGMLSAPCLGVIPYCQPLDLDVMAASIQTDLLLKPYR